MLNDKSAQLSELLANVAIGDRIAFKKLYDLCAAKLNGVAYTIVNNVEVSNEITQEAFLQIWKNSSEFNSELAQPMTWMSSIVRYRAYDYVRKESNRLEGRMQDWGEEDMGMLAQGGGDSSTLVSNRVMLNNCLSLLSREQCRSVLMAYYYGFSREEIALRLERPVNTVKSIVRRGLTRLQTCLSQ